MKKESLTIGHLTFENPFILAPMAGISDSPFRRICRSHGCGLAYSEMVSAKALYYGDKNTQRLLAVTDEELPVAFQIFGSEPEIMGFAAEKLSDQKNCILDINMGCPVPKVVKNGEGSALLKNPDLAFAIIAEVVKRAKKPVTVKIRIGWDEKNINGVEIAKAAAAAGAAAIAVHGRTREQYYAGNANWEAIRQVKAAVNIPVIGNGDVWKAEDGMRMLAETGVDFVMVARGALGNPWIFEQLRTLWEGGIAGENDFVEKKPSLPEIIETMLWQLEMMEALKGEYAAVREMRKHVGWYVKGIHGAANIRQKANSIEKADDFRTFLTFLQR